MSSLTLTPTRHIVPFTTIVLQLFRKPIRVELHGHRKVYLLADLKAVLSLSDEVIDQVRLKGERTGKFFIRKEGAQGKQKWFADELAVVHLCLSCSTVYSAALKVWAREHLDDISARAAAALIADTDARTGELHFAS